MDSIVGLLFLAAYLVGFYKVFEKMGITGWKSIVPLLNIWVLIEEFKKPSWFIVLLIIPFANFYLICSLLNGISKGFGKGVGFTIGLLFLGFIFFPLLAFTDAKYTKQT